MMKIYEFKQCFCVQPKKYLPAVSHTSLEDGCGLQTVAGAQIQMKTTSSHIVHCDIYSYIYNFHRAILSNPLTSAAFTISEGQNDCNLISRRIK